MTDNDFEEYFRLKAKQDKNEEGKEGKEEKILDNLDVGNGDDTNGGNEGNDGNDGIVDDLEWRYYHGNDSRHSSDPSRVNLRKREEKNIHKELSKYKFPASIRDKINALYIRVMGSNIKRSNSRIGAIMAAAIQVYNDIGQTKTIDEIAELMGGDIDMKRISKGKNNFNRLYQAIDTKIGSYITPKQYISSIMITLGCQKKFIQEAERLYEKIENKSSKINSSRPNSVAAALVYYYFIVILGKNIDCIEFAKECKLSKTTIDSLFGEINKILGTNHVVKKGSARKSSARKSPLQKSPKKESSKENKESSGELVIELV